MKYKKQKAVRYKYERAKRQILRKSKEYMKKHNFTTGHVKKLENTTEKTIELYKRILPEIEAQ